MRTRDTKSAQQIRRFNKTSNNTQRYLTQKTQGIGSQQQLTRQNQPTDRGDDQRLQGMLENFEVSETLLNRFKRAYDRKGQVKSGSSGNRLLEEIIQQEVEKKSADEMNSQGTLGS